MAATDNSHTDIQQATLQSMDSSLKSINEQSAKQVGFLSSVSGKDLASAGARLAAQGYGAGKELVDVLGRGLESSAGSIRENIEGIRESYGGFFDDEFEYKAEAASSNAMRRFQVLTQTYADEAGGAIMGTEKMGSEILENISSQGNILDLLIGSPAKALTKVDDLLADLSTTYGNALNKLSEESIVKMAFYEKGLGTSASTLQSIFQKQIAFTGEISTDVLDKLGAYANNISKELNIPMTYLTDMTAEVMANTQMFGNITVEEATRMSAKLTQLGFTFDQLSSQQQKFGTFQGAAQAAGTIAQLTGAQVDAMKMSFLTSEGKFDELIEYQRDSLFKAGMTKEKFMNQSNAMRNAIADSFGRSQEEMAVLLDKNRKVSSQEELDRIMKEGDASEQEGFDRIIANIDQTKQALKSTEEIMSDQKKRMELGIQEELYRAVEVKEKQVRGLKSAMEGLTQSTFTNRMREDIGLINKISENLNPKDFAGNIEEYFKQVSNIGGDYIERLENLMKKLPASNDIKGDTSPVKGQVEKNNLGFQAQSRVELLEKQAEKNLASNEEIKVTIIDQSKISNDGKEQNYNVIIEKINKNTNEIRKVSETTVKKGQ